MPRRTAPTLEALLPAYVRACQFNCAQEVTVGFRECAALLGIPYATVKYHLQEFTRKTVIDYDSFSMRFPYRRTDNQRNLNDAVAKWREGRARVHAACRCKYPDVRRRLMAEGATLQAEARWLVSAYKNPRRSIA